MNTICRCLLATMAVSHYYFPSHWSSDWMQGFRVDSRILGTSRQGCASRNWSHRKFVCVDKWTQSRHIGLWHLERKRTELIWIWIHQLLYLHTKFVEWNSLWYAFCSNRCKMFDGIGNMFWKKKNKIQTQIRMNSLICAEITSFIRLLSICFAIVTENGVRAL